MQDVGAELRWGLVEGRPSVGVVRHRARHARVLHGSRTAVLGQRVRIDSVEQASALDAIECGERVGLISGMQIVELGRRCG